MAEAVAKFGDDLPAGDLSDDLRVAPTHANGSHGGQAPAADRHARDVEQDPDHDQRRDDHDDHSENISQRLELTGFT